MKTDNIFKFVSVRPPQKLPKNKLDFGMKAAETALEKKFRETLEKDKKAKIAKDYLDSDLYFLKSTIWKAYDPALDEVEELIKKAAKLQKADDLKKLKEAIIKKIGKTNNAINKDLPKLKTQIWDSFYANLLSLTDVEDRDRIVRWIKFLKVWDTLESGDTVKSKISTIKNYKVLAPIIPQTIFQEKITEEQTNSKPNDFGLSKRIQGVLRLRDEIHKLNKTRIDIESVFNAKLTIAKKEDLKKEKIKKAEDIKITDLENTIKSISKSMLEFKNTVSKEFENIRLESSKEKNVKNKKSNLSIKPELKPSLETSNIINIPATSYLVGNVTNIPWHISTNDLKNDLTKNTLSNNQIDLETVSAPEIITKLESKIAEKNFELENLMTVERIIPRGKTFVRVKRRIQESEINKHKNQ